MPLGSGSNPTENPNTDSPNGNDPTATSEFFFKGKFDNVLSLWEVKENGNWSLGTSSSTSLDGQKETIEGRIGPSINQSGSTGSVKGISIEFGVFSTSIDTRDNAVKLLLKTGVWDFATHLTNSPEFKNVDISYRSSDNINYGVNNGDQTGSKFEVLSIVLVPASGYESEYYKIKFKFNCKLYPYDNSSGTFIELTEAEGHLILSSNL